ncbi:unnamed protein product [Trifolium pratense]|uniref:Uncharacterized protein n=1 Tax=Trifolium pratense TaxID=57577 RepID=A0ACB0JJV6_TRIPR|nr:unnamed protein product [Trifolium pratense]
MTWLLSHMDDPALTILDQSKVDTLLSFGFQENIARKALKASGGDIEKATDWIILRHQLISSMDTVTSNTASISGDVGLPDGGGSKLLLILLVYLSVHYIDL